MNAAARDTRLPLQARAIAFWILDNPTEGIDPDIIAKANDLAVSYVRKLLAKLAEFGHLIAPKKYRAEKGRIAYTPYELPPQDKITVTVEEPSRSETPYGQNNQNGQETVTVKTAVGQSSTIEYVHGDAATRVKDLSLEQEQKTTTTTTAVVVVSDSHSPPSDDGLPLVEQAGEMGDVARAYDRYCRGVITSQHSDLFTVLIEDYGGAKVVEAFKAGFSKNDPWDYAMWWLKNPQLVDKPKPSIPSTQTVTAQQIADNRRYLEDLARSDSELYLGLGMAARR